MIFILKLILKIIALPLALVLTVLAAFLKFILIFSGIILVLISGLVFLAAIILFITGEPIGGIAFLVIAFLISPFGIPAIAAAVIGLIDGIASSLREFITS